MKLRNNLFHQITQTLLKGSLLPAILGLILALFYAQFNLQTAIDSYYHDLGAHSFQAEREYLKRLEELKQFSKKDFQKARSHFERSFKISYLPDFKVYNREVYEQLKIHKSKLHQKLNTKYQLRLQKLKRKIYKKFPILNDKNFNLSYFNISLPILKRRLGSRLHTNSTKTLTIELSPHSEEFGISDMLRTIINLLARRLDYSYSVDLSFTKPFKELLNLDFVNRDDEFQTLQIYGTNSDIMISRLIAPQDLKDKLFDTKQFSKLQHEKRYFGFLVLSIGKDQFMKSVLKNWSRDHYNFYLASTGDNPAKSPLPNFDPHVELNLLDVATNQPTSKKVDLARAFKLLKSGQRILKTVHRNKKGEPIYSLFLVDSQLKKNISIYQVARSELLAPSFDFLKKLVYSLAFFALLLAAIAVMATNLLTRPISSLSHIVEKCSESLEIKELQDFQSAFQEISIIQTALVHKTRLLRRQFYLMEELASFQMFLDSKPAKEKLDEKLTELYPMLFGFQFQSNESEESSAFDEQIRLYHERVTLEKQMQSSLAQKREFELAQKIQEGILPKGLDQEKNLACFYKAARYLGGDFYDIIFKENRVYLVMADVSGKGLAASLFASRINSHIHSIILKERQPNTILEQVNQYLLERPKDGFFCTLFVACLDLSSLSLQYSSAGHNKMILRRDRESILLSAKGLPLGLFDMNYELKEETLNPQDLIFLYTDGVTECENNSKELYEMDRLKQFLDENEKRPVKQLKEALYSELLEFAGEAPQSDDITFLFYRV